MASPPFRRVSFGGTILGATGRQARGFALTSGKAERLRLTPGPSVGRKAAAPFSVRRSPLRTRVAFSRTIKRPTGDPNSRAGRGRAGLPGAQTRVSTVSAGVVRRNPTKHF